MIDTSLAVIIIAAAAPTLAAFVAYLQAKASKIKSEENAQTLGEVKHSVNSERSEMMGLLKKQDLEIAALKELVATRLATQEEKKRGEEKAVAVENATVKAGASMTEARVLELIKQTKL